VQLTSGWGGDESLHLESSGLCCLLTNYNHFAMGSLLDLSVILDVLGWLGIFQQCCSRFLSFKDHGINTLTKHNLDLCKTKQQY